MKRPGEIMTKEQNKLNREYNKQLRIIESARKGQQSLRPTATGYTEQQKEFYAKYQGFIDRAESKILDINNAAALTI